MSSEKLVEQVHQLKAALEEIEKRLSGGSEVPVAVLEDFKMAVDHTRMTVWALLSAADTDEYEVASQVARFRLKRGVDMFRAVIADIDSNEVTIDSPELQQFFAILKDVVARIERLYKSGV